MSTSTDQPTISSGESGKSTVGDTTRRALPPVVPLLAVGTFLMITTEYLVAGLLQDIATGLDVDVSRVGLLISAFAVGMILGSPGMALATLRLPRRMTLVGALGIFAVGHVVAALSTTFALVATARVIAALAAGAFWAVAAVVATTAAGPANQSRALGLMMSGVGIATVAGVPLGIFAGQLLGWRGSFWVLAAAAALAAPIIYRCTPADTHTAAPSVRSELRAVATGRMALLVLATVLATGGYMTTFSYLSPLVTERTGLAEKAVPLVFVVFGTGAVLGTNLAGRFADARPLTTFLTATTSTVAIMTLLALSSTNPIATFILIFALGIAGMGIPPVGTGLAVRFASTAPTLAAAIAVAAFNGGTALGTWIGAETLSTDLRARGPLLVGIAMATLGGATLSTMAALRLTAEPNHQQPDTHDPHR
ncbi:MAG: MFS transporter [Nocardioides sp.]|uniref:MFS transporter n=1 Tax=Nocardioides sp. TaxID=35761 RepID=UPI0039E499C4